KPEGDLQPGHPQIQVAPRDLGFARIEQVPIDRLRGTLEQVAHAPVAVARLVEVVHDTTPSEGDCRGISDGRQGTRMAWALDDVVSPVGVVPDLPGDELLLDDTRTVAALHLELVDVAAGDE